jgi:hypothetical protein
VVEVPVRGAAPENFRYDIMAIELAAALKECVRQKGLPSRVTMAGMAIRDQAERLRLEIEKRIEKIDAAWNKDGRRKFSIAIAPGRGPNGGYDVTLMVEEGQSRIVVPTNRLPTI